MKKLTVLAVKYVLVAAIILVSAIYSIPSFAQQQEKEKTPEEVAASEVKAMVRELQLSDAQEFYCDSILTHNYTSMKSDFENLQNRECKRPAHINFLRTDGRKRLLRL
jgi:Na+-transporting methylmalonyl-CoA/oxaloacetate decarboxylase gamma subunit